MGKPSPQPQPDHELVVLRDYIEGDPILDLTSACKSFADRLRELGNELAAAKLKAMMAEAGFARCTHRNLSGGIVAIHSGYSV